MNIYFCSGYKATRGFQMKKSNLALVLMIVILLTFSSVSVFAQTQAVKDLIGTWVNEGGGKLTFLNESSVLIEGAGRFVADVLSWRDIINEDSTTSRDYPTGVLVRYRLRTDSGYWHIFIHRDKRSILFLFDGDITEAIRYIKQ